MTKVEKSLRKETISTNNHKSITYITTLMKVKLVNLMMTGIIIATK